LVSPVADLVHLVESGFQVVFALGEGLGELALHNKGLVVLQVVAILLEALRLELVDQRSVAVEVGWKRDIMGIGLNGFDEFLSENFCDGLINMLSILDVIFESLEVFHSLVVKGLLEVEAEVSVS